MYAGYIEQICEEIRRGCYAAGCGNFTTEVTIIKDGVTFTFPLFVAPVESNEKL